MEFDIKIWIAEKPFEIDAWASALGIGALASQTVVEIIGQLAPTLAKLSPGALQAWRDQQELLLATAQWVRAGTAERAAEAIARGAETEFGKALAGASVLHDTKLLCVVGDHAKHFPPVKKE